MIGIVGGVGPYAGWDLFRKVLDNTLAESDQEHLDVVLLSVPSAIMDRTEYLLGRSGINPAFAIAEVLVRLEAAGACVAGIPCNTAHAPEIFSLIQERISKRNSRIKVLHLINETVSYIGTSHPGLTRIGVLSTTGTYRSGIYLDTLEKSGYRVILPTAEMQERLIHPAVYDPEFGIKTRSNPVHPRARESLLSGISYLKEHGAEAVIMGCTEIPMAISGEETGQMVAIDPADILARALIRTWDPDKLKPEDHDDV
jgi:aspartate racemase